MVHVEHIWHVLWPHRVISGHLGERWLDHRKIWVGRLHLIQHVAVHHHAWVWELLVEVRPIRNISRLLQAIRLRRLDFLLNLGI